jgi:hypothetical protein
MIVTPITPPSTPDVYQIATKHGGTWFRRWTGTEWMAGSTSRENARFELAVCRSPTVWVEQWLPNGAATA